MTITIEQLVEREVKYCISYLIMTVANGFHAETEDLRSLIVQAQELSYSVEDWESAAKDAGWRQVDYRFIDDRESVIEERGEPDESHAYNWQELCQEQDIEPEYCDVYEHWIVSSWLADELIKHGEKVDKDFGGMAVWARTTTGQAISQDHVIQMIYRELVA